MHNLTGSHISRLIHSISVYDHMSISSLLERKAVLRCNMVRNGQAPASQGHAQGVQAKGALLKGAFEPVSTWGLCSLGFPEDWGSRRLNRFNNLDLQSFGKPILWGPNMATGPRDPFPKTHFAKTRFTCAW